MLFKSIGVISKAHTCVIERYNTNEPHLTERQQQIMKLISTNPSITKAQMAETLKVSLSTIMRELKLLPVRYEGNSMDGNWVIS